MTPSKTVNRIALSSALAAALVATPSLAEATTLRIAHVWPGGSLIDRELFQAWAESVEAASEGRLEVEVYPSQTLAKSDKTYESAVTGVADIGASAQGYNAGRFPLTQVAELPGVSASSRQGSCILQSLYDQGHFDEEYSDTRPLFLFTTGPGYLHTKERLIETPQDLEGLRLRRPTPVVGDMFNRLGAQAVGMPAPDVFTAMQRGVVDGLSFNWEGMKTFRLNELANYHTEVPLYDLSLFATMSQRTYDSLPTDLQQVIDDHSGLEWSLRAAAVYDELIRQGRQDAEQAGHEFLVIDDALEHPEWGPVLQQTIDGYLEEVGGEAGNIYEAAMALRAECAA
ncbi:TRAP transporter substrate-binding protein [Halomonas sp. MCCC 1A17488]|uniref:TRAP transporter substrate-binding protein n=1 Tax=unclassified Halomonas TaxID=2609666 RepID=UPI0018D23D3D|nr:MULTISPECIES: TRAP transporter substrate-binding protein [unclassified Halomonas]MCE8018415.1 TRAP transporter substrate-binding protein [Halomonas sp. MCCC 1A17488]MCG3241748.1 TRAP transporter substrate-binding protein [Halomonas sp. MCCC 1A17488]QPP49225.1 TRAP transporter substrate-binding protein [Halomonas sp. SS10-MC5]